MGIYRSSLFGLFLYFAMSFSGMPICSAQQGVLWRPDELPKVYVLTPQAVTFKGVRIDIEQF